MCNPRSIQITFLIIFTILLLAQIAPAEYGIAWEQDYHNCAQFLGSANMDNDPWEELVYCNNGANGRIIIINGANGAIEWDSGHWDTIKIAGGAQVQYGKSCFCDVNSDGIKEITFFGDVDGLSPQLYLVGYSPKKGRITTLESSQNRE